MKHIVSIVKLSPGRLATFNIKLFNSETVTAFFNTRAICLCISFSLYNQMSNKTQMVEMKLRVGQADSTSLCLKGTKVKKQFKHMFIKCQNLKQALLFGIDFTKNYRIGINWDHDGVSYLR